MHNHVVAPNRLDAYPGGMRTLLVFSGKGGSLKTTCSRELAVAATLLGRRVGIVDLDTQAGITGWFARREADTPIMLKAPADHDLSKLSDAPIDELIIDTPPGVPTYIAKLVRQAHAVLVPVRPSPDDLTAAASLMDLLATAREWCFVLTQTLPRSRLTDGALRQLAALGRVAPTSIGMRQDFAMAAITGKAAVEFAGTKSAQEVNELRSYVDSLMGFDTSGKKTRRRSG
jgi:chromosome partitioning protein